MPFYKCGSVMNTAEDPTMPGNSKSLNDKIPYQGRYADEPEVDYDNNPTQLYKLIENKEWDRAQQRIKEMPMEAMTWVSRREMNDGGLRWRLLPIHATCIFRAPVSVMEGLLGAYPDGAQMKDDQGMLPIHLACRNGASKGVVMLLLDYFPESIERKDRKGRTPLVFCEEKNHQNSEQVAAALRKFREDRERSMASNAAAPTTPKETVPVEAAQPTPAPSNVPPKTCNEVDYEHRTQLFRFILKKDWESSSNRCKVAPDEAWTWIVTKGFKGNLRFLPLHKACVLNPPVSLIENLIAAYPDAAKSKDQDGWLPLHCAAFYSAGKDVVDTLLVAHPKAAQSKDDEGRLPLHYACLKGADVAVVTSLLSTYPKAAQSKDDEGRLPIHHAASKGAPPAVIEALLNSSPKGASSRDDQGRLPLHHACRKQGKEEVVSLLLKAYPKAAQVKDDQEKLPIHYACQCVATTSGCNVSVVKSLVQAYPDSVFVKNGFGYTPLSEAKAMDNPKMDAVIQYLEQFKQQQNLTSPPTSPSSRAKSPNKEKAIPPETKQELDSYKTILHTIQSELQTNQNPDDVLSKLKQLLLLGGNDAAPATPTAASPTNAAASPSNEKQDGQPNTSE